MKTNLILTIILFLMMLFFPFIALINNDNGDDRIDNGKVEVSSDTVTVLSSSTGEIAEMTTEEYIFGAVCAEMPASYHEEALKAQAVACYTYLKWIKENGDNPEKIGADISDSASEHQAYITNEELKKKWGSSYEIYYEKVKDAVESVLYEYLEYDQKTAMTVFHALSPGKTHSAEEVWNSEVPYLKSVTAPGDKLSPDFSDTITLTYSEFITAFEGSETSDIERIISSASRDSNDFITNFSYNNKTFSSTDIRSVFSLKSPYFTVDNSDNNIIFTVFGKGHGIGMSQYSADYMARQGSTYEEILLHFYEGTRLVKAQ